MTDIETIENITDQNDMNSDHSSMDITVSTTRKASNFDGLLKYKGTPFDVVNVPALTIKRGIPRSNLSKTDMVSPIREREKRVDSIIPEIIILIRDYHRGVIIVL